MANRYLTKTQDQRLRGWETWTKGYFIFAFVTLIIVLVFSSQLGLSSADSWGPLGLIIALLVAPIILLQARLTCPACSSRIGWRAKLMAPDQCPSCGIFLRSRKNE